MFCFRLLGHAPGPRALGHGRVPLQVSPKDVRGLHARARQPGDHQPGRPQHRVRPEFPQRNSLRQRLRHHRAGVGSDVHSAHQSGNSARQQHLPHSGCVSDLILTAISCSTNFFRRFFLIKSVCRNVETKGKVFWK